MWFLLSKDLLFEMFFFSTISVSSAALEKQKFLAAIGCFFFLPIILLIGF